MALVRYARAGGKVRFTVKGMTNHELREVMVGLFLMLDVADREDQLAALDHYAHDPKAKPSWLAEMIAKGMGDVTPPTAD